MKSEGTARLQILESEIRGTCTVLSLSQLIPKGLPTRPGACTRVEAPPQPARVEVVGPTRQQARAALSTSILLTLLGFFGILQGQSQFIRSADPPGIDTVLTSLEKTLPEHREDAERILRAQWKSEARRPIAFANIVASAMLIIGSFLLIARRKSALWWITNAVVANCLVIGGQLWDRYRLLFPMSGIDPVLMKQLRDFWMFSTMMSLIVHLGVLYLARREKVRAYAESEGPPVD